MANPKKGEYEIVVGEGDTQQTYLLVMDVNAMVELEEALSTPTKDVTFQEIVERIQALSMRHIRAFVWAGLRRHHKEVTIQKAGDIILAAGGLEGLNAQLLRAATAAAPDPKDVTAVGAAVQRPRKAQANGKADGIGKPSTARAAKRA